MLVFLVATSCYADADLVPTKAVPVHICQLPDTSTGDEDCADVDPLPPADGTSRIEVQVCSDTDSRSSDTKAKVTLSSGHWDGQTDSVRELALSTNRCSKAFFIPGVESGDMLIEANVSDVVNQHSLKLAFAAPKSLEMTTTPTLLAADTNVVHVTAHVKSENGLPSRGTTVAFTATVSPATVSAVVQTTNVNTAADGSAETDIVIGKNATKLTISAIASGGDTTNTPKTLDVYSQ
jgi:hypothetical protein